MVKQEQLGARMASYLEASVFSSLLPPQVEGTSLEGTWTLPREGGTLWDMATIVTKI